MSAAVPGVSERERELRRQRTQRWRDRHPERSRASTQKWRDANKEERFWSRLFKQYGLTKEAFDEMYFRQGGLCAIPGCGGKYGRNGRTLDVDHNHTTGAVRGLLCCQCNLLLGHCGERPEILEAAAVWLREKNGLR